MRDEYFINKLKDKLLKEVKCPYCGADAISVYDYDLEKEYMCFNFNCKEECSNSVESLLENGGIDEKTCFDFQGKYIDYQSEFWGQL